MTIQQMMLNSASSLSATASPPIFSIVQNTAAIDTGNCTVTVVGGSSPTYSWTKVDGDAITSLFPTSGTTVFRATGMLSNETRHAEFVCQVTSGGVTVSTNLVSVTMTRA